MLTTGELPDDALRGWGLKLTTTCHDTEAAALAMDHEDVRAEVERLIEAHGDSLVYLSRLLGRNVAWMQQYLRRGTPERLSEDDRLKLAMHWRIDERRLGAREPWRP